MSSWPFGSIENAKVESAIAASKAIIHDESSAETLLMREKILCIPSSVALLRDVESLKERPSCH